ncbi:MAG: DUF4112 domain-containing protein [Bacteroidota bacterium]
MSKRNEVLTATSTNIQWMDTVSELLDSRFRVPGTSITFGVDFLIGLIPGVGDITGYILSSALVVAMAKKGVSSGVLLKMLGNVILDAVIGAIPIVGDLFDLTYKANRRNFNMLKKYHESGKQGGNAWGAVIVVLLVLIAIFGAVVWLIFNIGGLLANAISIQ